MVGVPQLESPLRSFCCCVVDLAELTRNVGQIHFEIPLENLKNIFHDYLSILFPLKQPLKELVLKIVSERLCEIY